MNNKKKLQQTSCQKFYGIAWGACPPPDYEQAEDQVGLLSVRDNKREGKFLETKA